MSESREFDVIVVGCGGSGLSAALAAQEKGARVCIVERASKDESGGNTRYTGGTFHLCLREITLAPDLLHKLILETTDGFVKILAATTLSTVGQLPSKAEISSPDGGSGQFFFCQEGPLACTFAVAGS